MSTADDLRRLADLVERIETGDATVREVTPRVDEGDGLVAEVTLELSSSNAAVDGTTGEATGAEESGGSNETPTEATADAAPEVDAEPATDTDPGVDADDGTETGDGTQPGAGQPSSREADEPTDPAGDAVAADSGDAVPCRHPDCEETFDTQHGMRVHAAKVHRDDDGDDAPVYTDPAALREAYERGETFAEMTEYLGVDVTPATVRRHMVDHGIHEPSSRSDPEMQAAAIRDDGDPVAASGADGGDGGGTEDAGSGEGGTEAEAADAGDGARAQADDEETDRNGSDTSDAEAAQGGDEAGERAPLPEPGKNLSATLAVVEESVDESVDLPEGVTLEAVVEAVESGRTLYDVSEELGLDRDRTRSLLSALDLADLVTGRLSERPEGEETASRIDARLRRFAEEGAEEAH